MALELDDLIAWFFEGAKPRKHWRIGVEHEKIGFARNGLRPLPYEGASPSIRQILQALQKQTNGRFIEENGRPIGLRAEGASVTLEPGGQLELSGGTQASISQIERETKRHLKLLSQIGQELGTGFLSIGYQPKWRREEIPWMPKARYAIMRRYMPKVGRRGLDMMLRTATIQVNLDFASEEDMARKVRVAAKLQPVVTALFASSPFEEGRPSGWMSTRMACWLDTDPARTGLPRCFFSPSFGFADWVKWVLDVPMYFVVRNGRYIDCAGASFRAFMQGKLAQLPGERPTIEDWELHLSTVFPDVRIKRFLELRGADAGPLDWICALPALWKGILYDSDALLEADEWTKDWRWEEVVRLRREAARVALRASFRRTTALALAQRMLAIAERGLQRLCLQAGEADERHYLRPLWQAVDTGQTQADRWLSAYLGPWRERIEPLFAQAVHP